MFFIWHIALASQTLIAQGKSYMPYMFFCCTDLTYSVSKEYVYVDDVSFLHTFNYHMLTVKVARMSMTRIMFTLWKPTICLIHMFVRHSSPRVRTPMHEPYTDGHLWCLQPFTIALLLSKPWFVWVRYHFLMRTHFMILNTISIRCVSCCGKDWKHLTEYQSLSLICSPSTGLIESQSHKSSQN